MTKKTSDAMKLVLSAQGFAQSYHFSLTTLKGLEWNAYNSPAVEGICLSAKGYIYGRDNDTFTFQWPANWWQHWKQDHAPEWFKRRWPVRHQTTSWKVLELYPDAGKYYLQNAGENVTIHVLKGGRPVASVQIIKRPGITEIAEIIYDIQTGKRAEHLLSSFQVAEEALNRLFCVEGDQKDV